MEFTTETTRIFLAIFIVVSGALAIVLFLISGLRQIFRWRRGRKEKGGAQQMPAKAAGGKAGAAQVPPAKAAGAKEEAGAPAAAKPFAGAQKYRIMTTRDPVKLDVYSGNRRIGSVRLGEEWEGARLLTLHLLPNEGMCAMELRPMKARPAGAVCSILGCRTGSEIGAVGTLRRKEGWEGTTPKPVYDANMEIAAQFDEITVGKGLLSAVLFDAKGKRIGGIARMQDGSWELALGERDASLDDKMLVACAAQLVAEQAGK